ncbi:alpha/beta hydrolase [Parapedobacter sp. ISTM3]|uniref:Alpha/beta hydrolase n=1 Tax=Parapedobacter luteus TaxID=623280 RepID=A0A1T4ZTC9_9SPHI|nr:MULTISPECIES: alpha/beta hydrolase-fold protein [Parapedobacter]MBK1438618.1 alpha/beta hydrolase [Parapedobacter sp. ISTM3]SKB26012.1 hypothetical protein SAMN05660226_00065 [Parapedobacter luteus]
MENIVALALFSCLPLFSVAQLSQPQHYCIAQSVELHSKVVGDTFTISIQTPKEYTTEPDKHYPIALLIDGDFYFPTLAPLMRQYEMTGLLPPIILVGIGYGDFQKMDALRMRDLLYPQSLETDELDAPGGGLDFYRFITDELLPYLEADLRVDTTQRTLLGHSFGGYFALFALLQQTQMGHQIFSNIVSASPSLWYNDFYLYQLPEELASAHPREKLNVIITAGGLENEEWTLSPLQKLTVLFNHQSVPNLYLNAFIYNFLDHMDTGQLSFMKGLQRFYSPAVTQ